MHSFCPIPDAGPSEHLSNNSERTVVRAEGGAPERGKEEVGGCAGWGFLLLLPKQESRKQGEGGTLLPMASETLWLGCCKGMSHALPWPL